MAKKVLFIDRDGTLINEAPPTYQLDHIDKLVFYPGMFTWLKKIIDEMDFELVMITNQDGLGTEQFPEDTFWPVQDCVMRNLVAAGIHFSEVLIDKTYPKDNAPTRKPGTGLLTQYINNPSYDIQGSYVIGDRITDIQLAKNLDCKGIWLNEDESLGSDEISNSVQDLAATIVVKSKNWEDIYAYLQEKYRRVQHQRNTNETKISIEIDLDGTGICNISTGLHFFDHMLHQVGRHSGINLNITTKGDLHIDEHHTIEDTAIALGEAFNLALGNKAGIERYGFLLPMDDALAQVAIDFGGRSWLVWNATFKREKVGDMPTEMFYHFFKSFSDAARCNLNIKAEGDNEHHKIEAIFKGLAKAIKMAVKRTPGNNQIPTTKGII